MGVADFHTVRSCADVKMMKSFVCKGIEMREGPTLHCYLWVHVQFWGPLFT